MLTSPYGFHELLDSRVSQRAQTPAYKVIYEEVSVNEPTALLRTPFLVLRKGFSSILIRM